MKKGKKFVLSQWSEILHLSWQKKFFYRAENPTDYVFFFDDQDDLFIQDDCSRLCLFMLAIFSFRQKVEVLHHDQWWDFVGFPPLPAQIKTCHCLKAVPWGHVMGFGGRPIRFTSECKKFQVCSIQTLPNCEA